MTKPDASNSISIGKVKLYYGWIVLVACLLLVMMSYGIRFSYGVFIKSLEADFGWTRALTSIVFSVYMLLGVLFAIIGGWISDRYGARIVFIIMGVFSFLGLTLTGLTGTLWHLFGSYSLLLSIGTGPAYIIATSLAAKWFIEKRALASAIVTSGVGLGSILIVPIAAYFIESYGWRFAFVVLGLIALVAIVGGSFFIKRPQNTTATQSEKNKDEHGGLNLTKGEQKEEVTLSFFQAIRMRNFWIIFIVWFFYAFCLFTIMTHVVPHAIDLSIDPIQAALIVSISGFANIPCRIIAGIISDRFGRKPVVLICVLIMVFSLFWLMQSSSLWMFYAFAIAFGAAYGGLAPSLLATIGDTFGARHMGVILGVLDIGWVLGAALGPALAGYIFDTTGKYDLAFTICIVATFIILMSVAFLRIPKLRYNNS